MRKSERSKRASEAMYRYWRAKRARVALNGTAKRRGRPPGRNKYRRGLIEIQERIAEMLR